jgi:hypothetical protein
VTWALAGATASVASGTALTAAADTHTATLALGDAQTGGTLEISAVSDGGGVAIDFPLASHPTGITSSRAVGDPTDDDFFGGVFDHVFTSNDGRVSSLDQVAVGEKFPDLPDPDSGSHTFETPFGEFTLDTGTLPDAASGASGNWFLTSAGELGGTHDNVTIAKSMIDIGKHLVSDANPTPAHPLPAGFAITQQFHWWCPHAASGSRWAHFATTTHRRELRIDPASGDARFVAVVNGQENAMDYEEPTGVTNATADPAAVEVSPAEGEANTVQIEAETFPSGASLHFSIRGAALGCRVDAASGVLTVGTAAGAVKVRAANRRNGPNWDEVDVQITAPAPTPPSAAEGGGETPAPPSAESGAGETP